MGKTHGKSEEKVDVESTIAAILKNSGSVLFAVFDDHKLGLINKDTDYIIQAVCGVGVQGPLTEQQKAIHDKIAPAVAEICDLMQLGNLSKEKKQVVLFMIRFMMAMKILFMVELFKNKINGEMALRETIGKSLEAMKTVGCA
jgi:hypothetical protein